MKTIIAFLMLTAISVCSHALNPSKTYATNPGEYGMAYEEVTFKTDDNIQLFGWLYKPSTPSTKMMIISDDGDGNMADLIEIASNFVSLGYNVLTYDYRGYGKSGEFKINNNFYIYAQFEKDLSAAFEYVKKFQTKCKTIQVYGVGIGASLSLCFAANHPEISKVIADSPYSTLDDIKKRIKEKNATDVLLPLGFNKYFLEPKYALEAKGATLNGILLIAGETDLIVTPKDIKELGKLRTSKIYVVKGVKSNETFTINKAKYFDEIKTFLK